MQKSDMIDSTKIKISSPTIAGLFKAVDKHRGISLFSAGTEDDQEITGINPVIILLEDKIMEGDKETPFIESQDCLEELEKLKERIDNLPSEIALLGYLSYDFKDRLEEKGLYKKREQKIYPDFYFALYEHYIVSSRRDDKSILYTLDFPFDFKSIELNNPGMTAAPDLQETESKTSQQKTSQRDTANEKERFTSAVEKTKELIRCGEIYQANITRKVNGKTGLTPVETALKLYKSNTIEYGVFARVPGGHIISTSPELLFRKEGNRLKTSPIKGTITRVKTRAKDEKNRAKLIHSEKDRAELMMIVDLLRNDLGRICKTGSVETSSFPLIMELSNVFHLYADISGELISDSVSDILRSLFPGGSITGCPKIRSCQLIDNIENAPRGIYTGSFGKINSKGDAVFNIMIRSLFQQDHKFFYHVGGGITILSDPVEEFEETVYKGKNIWDALKIEKTSSS